MSFTSVGGALLALRQLHSNIEKLDPAEVSEIFSEARVAILKRSGCNKP